MMKRVFGGGKNLLLKMSAMVSIGLDIAIDMESDAKKSKRAQENFLVAAELGHVRAKLYKGRLFDKNDPHRFVWFGRAAANGESKDFLNEMRDQVRNFKSESGHADVLFVIGRALIGHIDIEERTIFRNPNSFDARIRPANQALHFYEF
jgi:hypothetical protein